MNQLEQLVPESFNCQHLLKKWDTDALLLPVNTVTEQSSICDNEKGVLVTLLCSVRPD